MILAQYGYGPSDKIKTGISDGSLTGAILTASDIKPTEVRARIDEIRRESKDADIYFDPEYYVHFFPEAGQRGQLDGYPYFTYPKSPVELASPKNLQDAAREVLEYQSKDLGLKNLLSPTIEVTSFDGSQASYSLALLNSSVEFVESALSGHSLFGSLVLDENAFDNADQRDNFLDAITGLRNIEGFYLVVDQASGNSPFWTNPEKLASYLYFIEALHSNKKKVILGYCDSTALVGLSVGATHASIGWWQKTTTFNRNRFAPSTGGRRLKKYYSKQLLNSIFVEKELAPIVEAGLGDGLVGTTKYDGEILPDPRVASWSEREAILHMWAAIRSTAEEIFKLPDTDGRLRLLEDKISASKGLYESTSRVLPEGYEIATGPRKIDVWQRAIRAYRDR